MSGDKSDTESIEGIIAVWMQELEAINLWNLPGSSAVNSQLIYFAWLQGIIIPNPLSTVLPEDEWEDCGYSLFLAK
jgi:hypothetical protein